MNRAPLTLAAVATALVLAGCSAGTESGPAPDSTPAATGSAASAAPLDPTDPACLVGDWRISQDEMQSFYDAVSGTTEGLVLTIEGDTGLSFTTDTYLYTPSFTLVLDIAGIQGQGVTTGSIGGSYTGAEGVITTTVGENSLSTIVTIAGVTQDASSEIGSIIASDPINAAPFDCSNADAPELLFDIGNGDRTPVALTRAG